MENKILQTKFMHMVAELSESNSQIHKTQVLQKYKDNEQIKTVLKYTYSPYIQFGVTYEMAMEYCNGSRYTSKSCRTDASEYDDFISCLNTLWNRTVTGHDALRFVGDMSTTFGEYIVSRVIDKDLKCRIARKMINNAFGDIIPEFKVALANKFDDFKSKINFQTQNWYVSRKMNGVRLITIVQKDEIHFYSREGKELFVFDVLKNDIQSSLDACTPSMKGASFILDGEVCIVKNGMDNFKGIVSQIHKKDYTIDNPKYYVIDFFQGDDEIEHFLKGTGIKTKWSNRQKYLKEFFDLLSLESVKILKQVGPIRNGGALMSNLDLAEKKGWEGLILRLDTTYKGKRSNDLLKLKKFQQEEFKVIGLKWGPISYIKDGVNTEEVMLSSVSVKYKGNKVRIGSGFSIQQRQYYFKNPNELLGKTITVKFFEESENKDGKKSLQFPTLVHIWTEGRDV